MMENRHVTMKVETFDTAILCYDHLNVPLEATKEIYCRCLIGRLDSHVIVITVI